MSTSISVVKKSIGAAKKMLTVISFGGGQDSTAILLMYLFDPMFRAMYTPGDVLVVMSSTGDEHQHTEEHVQLIRKLCSIAGIEFYHLTSDMGYHVASWPDLITPQIRKEVGEFKPTMVQLGTKTCTLQLKIGPIYKFLDFWINQKYGYGFKVQKTGGCQKQAIKRFGEENGQIQVLIGFAFGEESRMEKSLRQQEKDHKGTSFWKYITRRFPLIDRKMDRKACQDYIASKGIQARKVYKVKISVPYPSNCRRCPYMSPEELYWLYLNDRPAYDEWVRDIEAPKIKRFKGDEKNHGVFNTKELIPDKLAKVMKKYAHLEKKELLAFLDDYKMNHGCGSGGH